MDCLKNMYEEGLVEKQLDEDVWADIRTRRIDRLERQRNIALLGYLVGIENALKAKRAAEEAAAGRPIPRQFVKGYQPIFDMIDDIVEAGPSFVNQLRVLHKRAVDKLPK